MLEVNNAKNRQRDPYSFANINLLGRCNVNCFFCLGKDIEKELKDHDQVKTHFNEWRNFAEFLARCKNFGIKKIYITGQNTDSLLYYYLSQLIDYLHDQGFKVGLRTNGYLAAENLATINRCELSTGYSIHSLNPITTRMILGRSDMPDWEQIIPKTERPRVSIVLNRCNEYEFWDILKFISKFRHSRLNGNGIPEEFGVRYVQVRRVSTDTRLSLLAADMAAYERIYTQVRSVFGAPDALFVDGHKLADAEEYEIYGLPVVFWRTVKTSVNSINYFTDGTISEEYFVVEGYLKNMDKTNANR